ncbi:MAG: DUF2130 domain-containing protein, partial [Propionibacteriaceae bacterium]|nr:DUF2130 domain-containing protein [Propionibacteriaceae bacterium]
MHEITCPQCGTAFTIDEAGYADIVRQVRDDEFDKALSERLGVAEQAKKTEIALAEAKIATQYEQEAAKADAQILSLQARLDAGEVAQKLAVTEALDEVEKQRTALAGELDRVKQEMVAARERAEATLEHELQKNSAAKDSEIQQLRAQVEAAEVARKLAVVESVGVVEKERDDLKGALDRLGLEKQLAETSLKDKYETQIKDRDDMIERLRDLKAKLSTKM